MALRGEIKLYNNERVNELSLQVRRFGKNINEIVKLAQMVKNVNETDIENLEKHMKSIDEAISDWCKPFKYEVM
jgi:phage host-nuclease inhibitor protein Gam